MQSMAKKVRKPRSASPRTYGQAGPQPAQTAAPAAVKPQSAKPAYTPAQAAPKSAKVVDLRAEYPFVGKDLGKLGLTSAAMFAVLIVLNVVLNLLR